MKVIAVHEMFHACGLDDRDHNSDDLFQGNPQVGEGGSPANDKIQIPGKDRRHWMPPLVLSAGTAGKVRRLWSGD
jgi:hypothetical protein